MATSPEVDKYIAGFPVEAREVLSKFRALAHEVDPNLTEAISYGVMGFKLSGKSVFYVGGFPKHISIYPVPRLASLQPKIEQYVKGKGTIQFQLSEAIPYELAREIFQAHVHAAYERQA